MTDQPSTTEPTTIDLEAPGDRPARSSSGLSWIAYVIVGVLVAVAVFIVGVAAAPILIVPAVLLFVAAMIAAGGFYLVQPNQAAVLTLFGDYKGTDDENGLRWTNPFISSRRVSQRVRNFTTPTSKVNDSRGNPIEIAAVVVWRITDAARSVFAVDEIESYVETQSEAAVRHLARSYPYDAFDESDVTTLTGDTETVNHSLLAELRARVANAGVEVLEARINDLAYAPEIAEAMLRRQQAAAIVAARTEIVEGAVLMVKGAIESLEDPDDDDPIRMDEERRATFAANLMTVIASDAPTNPVVNVGTLHR
ncbi:MAG: SPFH domain-containing protein [Actinomycetota bacterium]